MKRWNRWTVWLSLLIALSLLAGCSNAANYVRDTYPLVSVDGQGKSAAKVYEAKGKTVPEVAKELAKQEKPKEISKENSEQMFLVYDNRIVNIQQNPEDKSSSLIQIDSIEYAKQHYDSSFLEGYLTATILQSLFGGGWYDGRSTGGSTYKGYTSTYSGSSAGTQSSASKSPSDDGKPATADRTGSFTSKGNTAQSGTADSGSVSGSQKAGTTGKWTTSSQLRKNDGSTPSFTKKSSKPVIKKRTGSFKRR
jgi:hypothetical protein